MPRRTHQAAIRGQPKAISATSLTGGAAPSLRRHQHPRLATTQCPFVLHAFRTPHSVAPMLRRPRLTRSQWQCSVHSLHSWSASPSALISAVCHVACSRVVRCMLQAVLPPRPQLTHHLFGHWPKDVHEFGRGRSVRSHTPYAWGTPHADDATLQPTTCNVAGYSSQPARPGPEYPITCSMAPMHQL